MVKPVSGIYGHILYWKYLPLPSRVCLAHYHYNEPLNRRMQNILLTSKIGIGWLLHLVASGIIIIVIIHYGFSWYPKTLSRFENQRFNTIMWPSSTKGTSCRPGLFWDKDQNRVQNIRKIKGNTHFVKVVPSKESLQFLWIWYRPIIGKLVSSSVR